MKHLRIKTKLFQRAALTLLLAVAGIANASADDWMGNSAIYVNGTWYWCSNNDSNNFWWCTGGGFNDAKISISGSTLKLGGQSQSVLYGSGTAKMYYRIDKTLTGSVNLTWTNKEGNNERFESVDNGSFTVTEIDISSLTTGVEHTFELWFNVDGTDSWDSNGGKNYIAEFKVNTITAKPQDGEYWATFYCGDTGFSINNNAYAYTATYTSGTSEDKITLRKLGKEIPASTAVIIVSESATVNMNVLTTPTVTVPTNHLHGLDEQKSFSDLSSIIGGVAQVYMLSNKNNNFGFHKYGGTMIPAHKAFLALNSSSNSLSRGISIEFEDDGTTGIKTISNASIDNDIWYSLDGCRLNGKPSQHGVYINNGKKVVIK